MKIEPKGLNVAHAPSTLAHPGEFALACLAMVFAVRIVIVRWLIPTPAATQLPDAIAYGWVVLGFAGGLLVLTGLMWHGTQTMGRGIETAGHALSLTLWLTYGGVIVWLYPAQSSVVLFMLCFVFANLGRMLQLHKINKAVDSLQAIVIKGE